MRPQDVQIPSYFSTFINGQFGETGKRWIETIPDLVARYAETWDIEVQPPFEGLSFNYVAPATRVDGTHAVLKAGLPEQEQRAEIFALRAFAGRGIIELLEANPDEHVSLLERLTPGTMLETLFPQQDDEATAAGAQIMNELAIPVPGDQQEFLNVEGWATRGMEGLRVRFNGGTGPFPKELVERAESLFSELLASTDQPCLIHGDLHHTNILSSDAHGRWLAIDPKGVIADRAFEAAAFILNPNTRINETAGLKRILARRIELLSETLEIERERIHGWTLAFSVLSAWWSYGGPENWRQPLELGEILTEI